MHEGIERLRPGPAESSVSLKNRRSKSGHLVDCGWVPDQPAIFPRVPGKTGGQISAEARSIWEQTAIRKALGARADRLLDGVVEVTKGPGEIIYEFEVGQVAPLIIIVAGLVRTFASSLQGRQATLRYVTAGDSVGLPVLLAPDQVSADSAIAVQTMVTTRALFISGRLFRETISASCENMWPMFDELVRSMMHSLHLMTENIFQPLRARVAMHLLDLAQQQGRVLTVAATQQDIADAIGSVREVVSRIIMALRDEGVIARDDGKYVILDPKLLYDIGFHNG
jgi:CRP-like cAMP-binding protein